VITKDLRLSLARAAAAAGLGPAVDPGLRPTGTPGRYAASVALERASANPRETAQTIASALARDPLIATTDVTGPGYLTLTVTPEALAGVADRVIQAGPACLTSDALAQRPVPAPPPGDPLTAATWEKARAALAAQLTARLAAAAGAPVTDTGEPVTDTGEEERSRLALPANPGSPGGAAPSPVTQAVAFAGPDAVTFTLARAIPGKHLRVDPLVIARRVLGNPAYAVRYAHARAASGLRWVASFPASAAGAPCPPAGPRELALLDALSWLPERVVTAARRDRPDEFARYLEELASVTVEVLIAAPHPGNVTSPGSDRLTLAEAARTGLAAGLGLLGVSAPERLLAKRCIRGASCEPCRPPGWAASWGRAARRPPADAAGGPERA
jgi:arginyl-tRNA synthetase